MRKMQIPAYSPALCGLRDVDQSGVEEDTKKVIAIECAPIIVIEGEVTGVGISVASVVVADIAMVLDISMVDDLKLIAEKSSRRMSLASEAQ